MILVSEASLSAPVVLIVLVLVMALLFVRVVLSLRDVKLRTWATHLFDVSVLGTVVVFLLFVYLRFKVIG